MLADKIKGLRREAALSQEQLAERLGVSRQAVTRWETGLGTPDLDNLVALADLFGVTVDSLLRQSPDVKVKQEPDARYMSMTQCDVFSPHDFDITWGHAARVELVGTQSDKVRVTLKSDSLESVESAFKVRLDPDGRNFDIDVVSMGVVTDAQARAGLDVVIEVPAAWENHIELEGNADEVCLTKLAAMGIEVGGKYQRVTVADVIGHVELDTNQDISVSCVTLPQRLDINQISATSSLCVPADSTLQLRKRGIGNHFVLDGVGESEAAEFLVELNGMRSELTISAQA
jgi:transcriptional regulator with XRE-family HTH domain